MKSVYFCVLMIALGGCAAHNYYYMPVIQGAGEKEPKGKVAYALPRFAGLRFDPLPGRKEEGKTAHAGPSRNARPSAIFHVESS